MLKKIVFMGSPEFAAIILKDLAEQYPISAVFTQPDRESGRGKKLTPLAVKVLATQMGIPVYQPIRMKTPDSFSLLEALSPDVIIVAAYGQILRQNVLDLPKFGCINVHASYLPRWRGAAPIQAAILSGDTYSGVSIMKMDAGIDTGPVLKQERLELDLQETATSLEAKLARLGGKLLLETLPLYVEGKIKSVPQNEDGSSYAPMLRKEDGRIDFSESATKIERKVRAYNDWPGTYLTVGDQILKIRRVSVCENPDLPEGKRIVEDGFPIVGTNSGGLKLLEIQPAGKKWMSGADYLRGNRDTWEQE
jgi:methionyl-tRNA formyltransferase